MRNSMQKSKCFQLIIIPDTIERNKDAEMKCLPVVVL